MRDRVGAYFLIRTSRLLFESDIFFDSRAPVKPTPRGFERSLSGGRNDTLPYTVLDTHSLLLCATPLHLLLGDCDGKAGFMLDEIIHLVLYLIKDCVRDH